MAGRYDPVLDDEASSPALVPSTSGDDVALSMHGDLGASDKLEFQDFDGPLAAGATSPGLGAGGSGAGSPTAAAAASTAPFYSIDYYRPWFDMDTNEVMGRLGRSVIPSSKFFETLQEKPDLYGPFWITTTLVFLMTSTANLASYFDFLRRKMVDKWSMQFSLMYTSAALLYLYVFLTPLALLMALKYKSSLVKLVELLGIYGYSMFIFLPTSVAMIYPVGLARWLFVLVAGLCSLAFILVNLRQPITDAFGVKATVVLAVIAFLHVAFTITVKAVLFNNIVPVDEV